MTDTAPGLREEYSAALSVPSSVTAPNISPAGSQLLLPAPEHEVRGPGPSHLLYCTPQPEISGASSTLRRQVPGDMVKVTGLLWWLSTMGQATGRESEGRPQEAGEPSSAQIADTSSLLPQHRAPSELPPASVSSVARMRGRMRAYRGRRLPLRLAASLSPIITEKNAGGTSLPAFVLSAPLPEVRNKRQNKARRQFPSRTTRWTPCRDAS
jgi:hypothetical protein